jgi:hypothetical protein
MERKEVHYHNAGTSGDGGGSGAMIGLIAGIVLVALGAFLWFGMGDRNVASKGDGPSVTVTAPPATPPATTGQGGGNTGGGGAKK